MKTTKDTWFEDHISSLVEEQKSDRKLLKFWSRPLDTAHLAAQACVEKVHMLIGEVITHRIVVALLVPLFILYLAVRFFAGESVTMHMVHAELIGAEALYWLGLGVLSSIGFGTGLHTGTLFMIPHVYRTVRAAEACGGLDFATYPVNPFHLPDGAPTAFECLSVGDGGVDTMSLLFKVLPWMFIWGCGTAFGEIPPYAVSYAAAMRGQNTLEEDDEATNAVARFMTGMKNWTINQIKKYGFWAVFFLAAYPNAAFDMCGMACGQFLMPFWEFITATLLGKGFVKVFFQGYFFVVLFSGDSMSYILDHVGTAVPPLSTTCNTLKRFLLTTRKKFAASADAASGSEEETTALMSTLFGILVFAAVCMFVKSILEDMAQSRQEELDAKYLDEVRAKYELLHEQNGGYCHPDSEEDLFHVPHHADHTFVYLGFVLFVPYVAFILFPSNLLTVGNVVHYLVHFGVWGTLSRNLNTGADAAWNGSAGFCVGGVAALITTQLL
eukprot:PhM_4_TR9156/c0_g1_i1/m.28488/K21248/VMP1; vacuole membrane protein 1